MPCAAPQAPRRGPHVRKHTCFEDSKPKSSGAGTPRPVNRVSETFEEYLKAAGLDAKGREKQKRKKIYLRRGIPYTPQVFPPPP